MEVLERVFVIEGDELEEMARKHMGFGDWWRLCYTYERQGDWAVRNSTKGIYDVHDKFHEPELWLREILEKESLEGFDAEDILGYLCHVGHLEPGSYIVSF